ALDRVFIGDPRIGRKAASSRAAVGRVAANGCLPTLVPDQRLPSEAGGVRDCHDHAAFRRHYRRPAARRFTNGSVRTTVEQNIVLRWISEVDLPDVYAALEEIGLGQPGAGTIVDITSCPGTDTCKLGISASRGLAGELRQRLAE